jgi:predicted phage tail component-like protein
MNYILWNGKDSRDIKGLIISELPPITKPNMRVRETIVDGVDGSIIEEMGYESYDKTVAISLKIGADVDQINEFFTGNGQVTFSNEPDRYYIARIIKSIDYARLLRYRVATVTFRVQPFKYNRVEVEVARKETDEKDGITVRNIGNYTAKPLLYIEGSGTVEVTINGKAMFRYNFPEEGDAVYIDSEKQDAYLGDALKNRDMVGEFPILEKGINVITWTGTVTKFIITKYSRWL